MNLILPDPVPMKMICSFAREGNEFERIYSIGDELGRGSFGEVYRCCYNNISNKDEKNKGNAKETDEYFAVKVNYN